MHNAPYPDESLNTYPTEPVIEDLPAKPVTPSVNEATTSAEVEGDGAGTVEVRQKDVLVFAIGKVNDFLQWFAIVLEIVLLLRFVFQLIGANPTNTFAGFLYALTDIVLTPFKDIVGKGALQTFASILIGMVVYGLIFFAIRRFLHILISSPEPVE